MHPFDEMKAYVRFGPDDARRLSDFWPHVSSRIRQITDGFYDRILEFDGARDVLRDPGQVVRLKRTMEGWLEELLLGPHDAAYYDRRRKIGEKHVAVGLAHRYMFTAMEVMQQALCDIASEAYPREEAHAVCESVRRISMLDLALMTGTYMGTRERARLGDFANLLVSNLPTAALLLDRAGRVAAHTQASEDLCGKDPQGKPFWDVVPHPLSEAAELDSLVSQAHSTGKDASVLRVDATLDGVPRSFRVTVVPLAHDTMATILQFEELTDSLAAEAGRRRMESLAQLGELSAAVAHELRNPLAGISGAVQVITGSLDADDRRRTVMNKVRDQISRLDRMVRDLLAFSRTPEVRLVEVDLASVTDGVCDLVRREYPTISFTREGQGHAVADADILHRVLLNLVQNAAAALAGPGHVEVRIHDREILVADDGPGVESAIRGRIFEPFFTTRTTGTGLGLAICRNAAEAMGARLELEPVGPLKGAAFALRWPSQA